MAAGYRIPLRARCLGVKDDTLRFVDGSRTMRRGPLLWWASMWLVLLPAIYRLNSLCGIQERDHQALFGEPSDEGRDLSLVHSDMRF